MVSHGDIFPSEIVYYIDTQNNKGSVLHVGICLYPSPKTTKFHIPRSDRMRWSLSNYNLVLIKPCSGSMHNITSFLLLLEHIYYYLLHFSHFSKLPHPWKLRPVPPPLWHFSWLLQISCLFFLWILLLANSPISALCTHGIFISLILSHSSHVK